MRLISYQRFIFRARTFISYAKRLDDCKWLCGSKWFCSFKCFRRPKQFHTPKQFSITVKQLWRNIIDCRSSRYLFFNNIILYKSGWLIERENIGILNIDLNNWEMTMNFITKPRISLLS